MAPFLISILVLTFLTIGAVLLFKYLFFKPVAIDELAKENQNEFDKALLTKHESVDIHKNRKYFLVIAAFITMLYTITFVEYPTSLKKDEEKADAKAVQAQTKQIEITEQKPEKPKAKPKKARREEVVEEEIQVDSTDQQELAEFIPDFGEEEIFEPEEEEYTPPIVERAEIRAKFPGGPPAFMRWAYNNIKIPEKDKQNGARGMVMVQFVVYEDGFVRDVQIKRGISPSLDNAVKELMENSPKWTPGSTQGQLVRERWMYPIKIVPK